MQLMMDQMMTEHHMMMQGMPMKEMPRK